MATEIHHSATHFSLYATPGCAVPGNTLPGEARPLAAGDPGSRREGY